MAGTSPARGGAGPQNASCNPSHAKAGHPAVDSLPGAAGGGRSGKQAKVKHQPARPKPQKWEVPSSGIRPPQRMGVEALLYLSPGEILCVQWLLRRLVRGEPLVRRALIFERRIRSATAVSFLRSDWVLWAKALLAGNGGAASQLDGPKELTDIRAELRETLGNAVDAAELKKGQGVTRR